MTKQTYIKHIVVSFVLTAIAIVAIVFFSIAMFKKYPLPNENNTSLTAGIVTDVYHAVPKGEIVVLMSNGELLKLVYPLGIQNLYSTIGYDVDKLADSLEGKSIQCRRMKSLPWAVEIYLDNTKIDNTKLTTHQMYLTRAGIITVGLIALAFIICGDVVYLKSKYHSYQKAERKRNKKAK